MLVGFGFLVLFGFVFLFVCLFLLSGTGVSFSAWHDEDDPVHSPLHPHGDTEHSLRTASEFQLPM